MHACNPDPRTTDDKFVIEIAASQNHDQSVEDLESALKETDLMELSIKELV